VSPPESKSVGSGGHTIPLNLFLEQRSLVSVDLMRKQKLFLRSVVRL
jgi:hypothetical protein